MNNNEQQYPGHIRRYIHGLAISVLCIPVVALAAIVFGIGFLCFGVCYLCFGVCYIFMMWAELLAKLTWLIYHSRFAPTEKSGETLVNPVARAEQAVIDQIKKFKF